jgi:hypothetical protein
MGHRKTLSHKNKGQEYYDAAAKHHLAESAPESAPVAEVSTTGQTAQRALVQRARLDPGSLSRRDVMELQRFMGNQAIGQIIQRKKTVEERAAKHRGRYAASTAIEELSGKLKSKLVKHIFDAWKSDGTEPAENAAPTGLHAYKAGNLPEKVTQVGVTGSTGQVHVLTWRWGTNATPKQSTMFPIWMSEDKVKTLIALKYSQDSDVMATTVDLAAKGITASTVKKSIQQGQDIRIGKSGDTVYPTR